MVIVIMCCVAVCFICWVLVLKAEIDSQKKEVARLKAALKIDMRSMSDDIAATGARRR